MPALLNCVKVMNAQILLKLGKGLWTTADMTETQVLSNMTINHPSQKEEQEMLMQTEASVIDTPISAKKYSEWTNNVKFAISRGENTYPATMNEAIRLSVEHTFMNSSALQILAELMLFRMTDLFPLALYVQTG
ncbi:hypothetical protein KIL84_013272 [Mauremys mutica]|uniref:Uncharacterized protein n=1 Tax=Mauremys mutica TaxID=74926 RepID=A0A9D3WV86_9SAUR|nr:hypothetical protein KIL84_013272 [Mauremys mutica]